MSKPNPTMDAVWRATVACCTTLHDAGLTTDEIAKAMPDAMKLMGDAIIKRLPTLLRGVPEMLGREHAGRLIDKRQGGTP